MKCVTQKGIIKNIIYIEYIISHIKMEEKVIYILCQEE